MSETLMGLSNFVSHFWRKDGTARFCIFVGFGSLIFYLILSPLLILESYLFGFDADYEILYLNYAILAFIALTPIVLFLIGVVFAFLISLFFAIVGKISDLININAINKIKKFEERKAKALSKALE